MQLLYCANNGTDDIVLGWHDDSQNVPASAYNGGTGVRVIPYADSVSTLPRVGPAPGPPMDRLASAFADTRPYAQPVETNAILVAFSGQVRWETVVAGITYNGNPVKTDRESQALIANLAAYASTLAPTDPVDFTQAGVHYAYTAQDVIAINNQVQARVQQCRSIEAQCLADLALATPTILTYADVETRFAGV